MNAARTNRPSLSGRREGRQTRGSRKPERRDREEEEAIPKRAKSQTTDTRTTKAKRVRRNYDRVAVFPFVKPRSCLNVKFRWTMIRTLRSIFPANRPGVTRWVHPRFPQVGVTTLQLPREGANPSSTINEPRVGGFSARITLGFTLVT